MIAGWFGGPHPRHDERHQGSIFVPSFFLFLGWEWHSCKRKKKGRKRIASRRPFRERGRRAAEMDHQLTLPSGPTIASLFFFFFFFFLLFFFSLLYLFMNLLLLITLSSILPLEELFSVVTFYFKKNRILKGHDTFSCVSKVINQQVSQRPAWSIVWHTI